MSMEITFPGGVAVESHFAGFTVRSDQPESAGGMNSAPSPFMLFLAALGNCTGYFALRFCQERNLSTEGLKLTLDVERNAETHRLDKVSVRIHLPEDFPEKYHKAILKAANQCAVKRTMLDPPEFEMVTV